MKKRIILVYFCLLFKIEKLKKYVEIKFVVCFLLEFNKEYYLLVYCVFL